jgi:hypothetical protein
MGRGFGRLATLLLIGAVLVAAIPERAAGAGPGGDDPVAGGVASNLHADLDGKPIALDQVGNFYCHDFDYPAIHCFSSAAGLSASAQTALATTSLTYVAIFDYPLYSGSAMYVSQNYPVLALIGWNDRVSSFIDENGVTGRFHTDWFYSGLTFAFCCNQWVASLGSYDNTFSSVEDL